MQKYPRTYHLSFSAEVHKMRIIFIVFMFIIMAHADMNKSDIYLIEPEQVYAIEQKIDLKMGNTLILSIKPEFWYSLFDYTLRYINKEAKIQIEDIVIKPYITEPIFHKIQILLPKSFILSQKFKSDISGIKNNQPKEEDFLEEMFKINSQNLVIAKLLITKYHDKNTPDFSKKCINIYDTITDKQSQISILENGYIKLYDCYMDLNQTSKAMQILDMFEPHISEEQSYELVEKKAYIFKTIGDKAKTKSYYLKALEILRQTDFLKHCLYCTPKDKQYIIDIKNREILRLEEIINTGEKQNAEIPKNISS